MQNLSSRKSHSDGVIMRQTTVPGRGKLWDRRIFKRSKLRSNESYLRALPGRRRMRRPLPQKCRQCLSKFQQHFVVQYLSTSNVLENTHRIRSWQRALCEVPVSARLPIRFQKWFDVRQWHYRRFMLKLYCWVRPRL